MLTKNISLLFEDCGIQMEYSAGSTLVTLRVDEYKLNVEKSNPNHEVYETANVSKIYLEADEVKEIIKALKNILPDDEEKNELIGFRCK